MQVGFLLYLLFPWIIKYQEIRIHISFFTYLHSLPLQKQKIKKRPHQFLLSNVYVFVLSFVVLPPSNQDFWKYVSRCLNNFKHSHIRKTSLSNSLGLCSPWRQVSGNRNCPLACMTHLLCCSLLWTSPTAVIDSGQKYMAEKLFYLTFLRILMFGFFPPVWACHRQVKNGWGHNPSAEAKCWGMDAKIRPAIPAGWQHRFGGATRCLGMMKPWQCVCSGQRRNEPWAHPRMLVALWPQRDFCFDVL